MKPDYYHILGLQENASEEEIKKNFRFLAKKYHPDSNFGNQEAGKRFHEITEAYEVLSDKEKRRIYDKERMAARRAGAGSSFRKEKVEPKRKTRTNPLDVTDMFERYMGIRR